MNRRDNQFGIAGDDQQRHGKRILRQACPRFRPERGRARSKQRGNRRNDNHQLLRMLAPDPHHQEQARAQGSGDCADGVGGINTSDQPRRILASRCDRCQSQGEARSPKNRGRQNRPKRSHEIQLHREHRVVGYGGIDRPVRKRFRQHECGPCHRCAQQHLAPGQGDARPRESMRQGRTQSAADAEPDKEYSEDQRKRVNRGAEQQRQSSRPDHFTRQRRESGKRNRQINWPGARRDCRFRFARYYGVYRPF